MNARIAKKILTCASTLHAHQRSVARARRYVYNNSAEFARKSIYLVDTGDGLRTLGVTLCQKKPTL